MNCACDIALERGNVFHPVIAKRDPATGRPGVRFIPSNVNTVFAAGECQSDKTPSDTRTVGVQDLLCSKSGIRSPILSRKHSEMRLPDLSGNEDGIRELKLPNRELFKMIASVWFALSFQS